MPDQVMMHRQRAMPELRALHQRLRLRNLPSTRKVTIFHHMRITASPFPPGETSIHAVYRCIRYSPRRAATPAGSADEDRAQPTDGLEQAPAQVGLPELRRRARMMFSGDTGGVVERLVARLRPRQRHLGYWRTSSRSSASSHARSLTRPRSTGRAAFSASVERAGC